jgi:RimJ/RimL family protein N-acetyltransferase
VERHRLVTARLELRPCGPADVDALHALWTDPEVRRFLWDGEVIPRQRAAAAVADSAASFAREGFGQWVVRRAGTPEPVGFCGLRRVDDEVELLYGLWPAHQGLGLASEASRAVLRHGFGALGLARIVARTDPPNRASVRVMERLGMRFEWERVLHGLPTVQYALAREDLGPVGP